MKGNTRPCANCGVPAVCDIPFAVGGRKGFKSAPHGCPDEFTQYEFRAEEIGWSNDDVAAAFAVARAEET